MGLSAWRTRLLRFAFHHFYNSFAWTYDAVSAVVSLGHWREWTRAALPHVRGRRVLEIAFGTGNLLVDLHHAGFVPVGIDLSRNMVRIAGRKLRADRIAPQIVLGSVLALPYAAVSFDSLVLTFPPNFLAAPQAVAEMRRVIAPGGRLVMVDAGWVRQPRPVGALINLAFQFTGTVDFRAGRIEPLRKAGFVVEVRQAGDARSTVQVLIADLRGC